MESVLIPSLDRITTIQSDRGISKKGNYRNLVITKRTDGRISINGSIQKFLGANTNPSFEESKRAIFKLCETFSFSPEEAQVKRVDIAKDISTQFRPKAYYPFLSSHQYLLRNQHKNTLYYTNTSRTRCLAFYDKAKEQNTSGNLLRYEYRDFRPDNTFKKIVMLDDFLEEENYNVLLRNWQSNYQTIHKVKDLIPMESFKNPTQFFNFLMAAKLAELGSDFVNDQLKMAQKSQHLTKQNAKRIRDKLKQLNKPEMFSNNPLIEELDSKILR